MLGGGNSGFPVGGGIAPARPAPADPEPVAAQRNSGGEPASRRRLRPGETTWIEIRPMRVRLVPRCATTTIPYVPGLSGRPLKRPVRRTVFIPGRPRTTFVPTIPQLGLGPWTIRETFAGAPRRKRTVVPRRFFGPRVEKRALDVETLPARPALGVLLLPPDWPEDPPPCPLVPPPDGGAGGGGGWGALGKVGTGGGGGSGGGGGKGGGGGSVGVVTVTGSVTVGRDGKVVIDGRVTSNPPCAEPSVTAAAYPARAHSPSR